MDPFTIICLSICAVCLAISAWCKRESRRLEAINREIDFLKPLLKAEYEAAMKAARDERFDDFETHRRAHEVLRQRWKREVTDKL